MQKVEIFRGEQAGAGRGCFVNSLIAVRKYFLPAMKEKKMGGILLRKIGRWVKMLARVEGSLLNIPQQSGGSRPVAEVRIKAGYLTKTIFRRADMEPASRR